MHTNNFLLVQAQDVSWREYRDLRLEALQREPRAYASTYASQKDRTDEQWQEYLQRYCEGNGNWMVFASDGHKLIGMLGAYQKEENKKDNSAELIAMYVNNEFRGKGIGKLLMTGALNELAKAGISKVFLEVHSIQTPAIKLYERFGFQIVRKVKFDLGNGSYDDDYVMEKVL